MAKTGRPSKYSHEICDYICEQLATSNRSLRSICQDEGIPNIGTVLRWLSESDKEEFHKQYARAKEQQADFLAEEILEIADYTAKDTIETEKGPIEDKEWVNRSRLRVDARKWVASKLKPKKYGDKIDVTSQGDKINTVTPTIKLPDGTTLEL